MPHAIFELDQIDRLPLWALVHLGSRTLRRCALAMAMDQRIKPAELAHAQETCDDLDAACLAGSWHDFKQRLGKAGKAKASRSAAGLYEALHWGADAAHAATDSLDFSAAESACVNSVRQAIAHAAEASPLNALQVRILLASDFDLLRFNCGEARIGRYDPLTRDVFQRLTPVNVPPLPPPDPPRPEDLAR